MFGAARLPEYPPVSACPPVRALKTVVLPLPGSPTMVTCIGSVPRVEVDDVEQRLAREMAPEVVDEQVDGPLHDAVRCP